MGEAGNAFQASTSQMRVQWEGFDDTVSGLGSCRLDVIKV